MYHVYVVVQLHPWFEFSFLLGFKLIIAHYCTPNQRKIKFKPRIPKAHFCAQMTKMPLFFEQI